MKSNQLSDSENAELMLHLERTIPPMNLEDAERLLGEVKKIFDQHEVVFFLRQGTCLGAVRDQALIAWDDDLDLGSIIGMHDFTEEMIEPAVADLRANGCYGFQGMGDYFDGSFAVENEHVPIYMTNAVETNGDLNNCPSCAQSHRSQSPFCVWDMINII